MGFMDKMLRKTAGPNEGSQELPHPATPVDAVPSQAGEHDGLPARWYAPQDGNSDRFIDANGLPTLRLIPYRDTGGEHVLRLCEDGTGLLVGPTDRRLSRAGIYVSQLRGEAHHQAECRAGNFYPGETVRLVREPENPYDRNAVAVYDATGKHMAAYVNKQKARTLAKLIDSGAGIEAISIRGTRSGLACDQVAILAASPEVLRHVLSPRPADAPQPAHER
ncbi:HIRAN domain-containing protein [Micromonospora noduli]|uniref:HIRAN domain-containing protein n=1 Tax=Micromonospora noduli TaxID=709876 RepID=UPI000DC2AD3A|nr:HIRAN domain-containing protein [Micromonospora noduli]RAO15238.1 hypothetical protein LUPAC07_03513 [Micromonospora noduli]